MRVGGSAPRARTGAPSPRSDATLAVGILHGGDSRDRAEAGGRGARPCRTSRPPRLTASIAKPSTTRPIMLAAAVPRCGPSRPWPRSPPGGRARAPHDGQGPNYASVSSSSKPGKIPRVMSGSQGSSLVGAGRLSLRLSSQLACAASASKAGDGLGEARATGPRRGGRQRPAARGTARSDRGGGAIGCGPWHGRAGEAEVRLHLGRVEAAEQRRPGQIRDLPSVDLAVQGIRWASGCGVGDAGADVVLDPKTPKTPSYKNI